jgi:predicted deacylase
MPTGGDLSLPLTVVHGTKPGPTLAVTAAIHGDELNGSLAIGQLLAELDPARFSGTLLALPILNPLGLLNHSRYLPDRRDLNRCFPGSRRGSLGSRIAHTLTTLVLDRADVVIDLHTGSLGRCNLPQLRCNLQDARARKLAQVFGTAVVVHASLRDGSLRAVCADHGRPALVYEGGEALRSNREAVAAARRGLLNVLEHLHMLGPGEVDPEQEPPPKVRFYAESQWQRAPRSGLCQLDVELGERVKVGQLLGTIHNPAHATQHEIVSDMKGLVIGRLMTSLVNRGDALVHVATKRYEHA